MLPLATNNMYINSGYFWFALATSDFAASGSGYSSIVPNAYRYYFVCASQSSFIKQIQTIFYYSIWLA